MMFLLGCFTSSSLCLLSRREGSAPGGFHLVGDRAKRLLLFMESHKGFRPQDLGFSIRVQDWGGVFLEFPGEQRSSGLSLVPLIAIFQACAR